MLCAPCRRDVLPSWTRSNWRACAACCYNALPQRPTEHGFATELWTLKRVRLLIERLYGVSFSEVHVWRILGALGFSPQKPEKRAIERNEDAVRSWKRSTWPALKKKPNDRGG